MKNTNIKKEPANAHLIQSEVRFEIQNPELADKSLKNERRVNQLKNLEKKDYLLTVYQAGDDLMSKNDYDRQVAPRRYYQVVSLKDLSHIINKMDQGFWEHPDLKADLSNAEDIPTEEKQWGIITDIVVFPLSEELEKSYVKSSQNGFFKHQRMFYNPKDLSNDFAEPKASNENKS